MAKRAFDAIAAGLKDAIAHARGEMDLGAVRFPFEMARRLADEEVERFRKAISAQTGKKRRPRSARPPTPTVDTD